MRSTVLVVALCAIAGCQGIRDDGFLSQPDTEVFAGWSRGQHRDEGYVTLQLRGDTLVDGFVDLGRPWPIIVLDAPERDTWRIRTQFGGPGKVMTVDWVLRLSERDRLGLRFRAVQSDVEQGMVLEGMAVNVTEEARWLVEER